MEPRIISFKPKANCTQFGCFDTVPGRLYLIKLSFEKLKKVFFFK